MSAFAPAIIAPVRLAILRCPVCAAAEPVDEAALAAEAHMISCRQCGEMWPARAGLAPSEIESGAAAIHLQPLASAPHGQADELLRRPVAAWGDGGSNRWSARIVDEPAANAPSLPWIVPLGCLMIMLLLAAFFLGRQGAVAAPEFAALYSAVGLPVHLTGLAIEDVDAERRVEGTGATVKVTGRLVNIGSEHRLLPPLSIQFQDARGIIMHAASAAAPVPSLAPGAAARFVAEVERVPRQAGKVIVRLGEQPQPPTDAWNSTGRP